jgi:hypothetical protein
MSSRLKKSNKIYGEKEDRENSIGFFRKWSGIGCRRAGCLMCHFGKHFGLKTIKDRKQDLDFKEQLVELEGEERVGKE